MASSLTIAGAASLRRVVAMAFASILAASGCSFTTAIHHVPLPRIEAPLASRVSVRILNERPESRGGRTTCVGRVRGGYGNPFPVHELDAASIVRTVLESTSDGLGLAGIAVADGSGPVLVGTIRDYWMDGYGSFNARVEVDYVLQDATGATLWRQSFVATGGATMRSFVFEAPDIAGQAYEAALQGLAQQLRMAFAAEDFRRHLAAGAPVATGS